jgi:hypothetical protein
MIVMKSSGDYPWAWAESGGKAEDVFKKEFPILHSHFKQFETELKKREDQGRFWWEPRPSQNYQHFESEYIAYQDIAFHSAFARTSGALPEMTAFCLPKADDPFLLAVLNSPLMWHLLFRITLHGKDEALRLKNDKMETIPIPKPSSRTEAQVREITPSLQELASKRIETNEIIADWLLHTFELSPDRWRQIDFTALHSDGFVSAVSQALPKKQKLTATEIVELKREHGTTVEPTRHARSQIFALEQRLSDLVNEAYGLTADEVDLMWRTAPLRMPFTPTGLMTAYLTDPTDGDEDQD